MGKLAAFDEQKNLSMGASAEAMIQRNLAEVQVAVMMAKKFPRDKIKARETLMNDCSRPELAELAMYVYARGGQNISGASIRLLEAAKNAWTNIESGWREISRLNGTSEIEAYAWDKENNTRESITFYVKHTRNTKKGSYDLTDERDIYELNANYGKRRERACLETIIDGDILQAAIAQCDVTLTAKADTSPEAIKKMLVIFENYKVSQEMIEKRLQRRLDSMTKAQMVNMRKIYNSLKEGMSKPEDWFDFEITNPSPSKLDNFNNDTGEVKQPQNSFTPASNTHMADVENDNQPFPGDNETDTPLTPLQKGQKMLEQLKALKNPPSASMRSKAMAARDNLILFKDDSGTAAEIDALINRQEGLV